MDIFSLKSLIREYYKLTDNCSIYKKKFSTDLRVIFPGYKNVFSNVTSNISLAILNDFPTPEAILSASKDLIIDILIKKWQIESLINSSDFSEQIRKI